jgi:hypothetical protein
MLFKETDGVHCENHPKHINTMWQLAKFSHGTADGAYNYPCSLND